MFNSFVYFDALLDIIFSSRSKLHSFVKLNSNVFLFSTVCDWKVSNFIITTAFLLLLLLRWTQNAIEATKCKNNCYIENKMKGETVLKLMVSNGFRSVYLIIQTIFFFFSLFFLFFFCYLLSIPDIISYSSIHFSGFNISVCFQICL